MSNGGLYKAAEGALYRYQQNKATVEAFELRAIMGRKPQNEETRRGSYHSDPTARGGMMLANRPQYVRDAMLWVWAVETAWAEMEAFAPQRARLMEKYYGLTDPNGRPKDRQPAVRYRIMEELSIGYTTFYQWRSDCVDAVIHAGIQCGVLVPYKAKPPA